MEANNQDKRCINHPGSRGVAFCKRCNGYICVDCMVTVEGKRYCKKCYLDAQKPKAASRKCINHPDKEGIAYCNKCGGYLCQECMIDRGDKKYCRKCYEDHQRAVHSQINTPFTSRCMNHPLNNGIFFCSQCFGHLCQDCIIEIEGENKCKKCYRGYDTKNKYINTQHTVPPSVITKQGQETQAGSKIYNKSQQPQTQENQIFQNQFDHNNSNLSNKGYSSKTSKIKLIKRPIIGVFAVFFTLSILAVALLFLRNIPGRRFRIVDSTKLEIRNSLFYEQNEHRPFSGKSIDYYEGGQKKREATFQNGKQHGLYMEWFWDGKKKKEIIFQGGNEQGPFLTWYKNGQKEYEGVFQDGKKQTPWKMWTREGKIIETEVVTDIDKNTYLAIKIGKQWWMAENLKVTHYQNGDALPEVTDNNSWTTLSDGASCCYNNDKNNAKTYGLLYNWFAINDTRNIAPIGWHVPSYADWQILIDYLGGENVAAGKIKETATEHWDSPNTDATNESGFKALPGGCRSFLALGEYFSLGTAAFFGSSTTKNSRHAWYLLLVNEPFGTSLLALDYRLDKKVGMSVRCIKD